MKKEHPYNECEYNEYVYLNCTSKLNQIFKEFNNKHYSKIMNTENHSKEEIDNWKDIRLTVTKYCPNY